MAALALPFGGNSFVLPVAVLALALGAGPALAAPSPTPTPGQLPISGVTVDIQAIELAPGLPAKAPAGSHVEQAPRLMPFRPVPLGGQNAEPIRGFSGPARPSASPSVKP